jgi:hypothetical protein
MLVFVLSLLVVFNGMGTANVLAAQTPSVLVSGLQSPSGSTIGPDGALYVTESKAGTVTRIDPKTGTTSTFASGLPVAVAHIGGPVDVAFLDGTPYILVSMVSDFLGTDQVGIYRMDGPSSYTVVADLGAWSIANPSQSQVFLPSGVYYAMEAFRGGFLVTDGHHNRVLYARINGEISEMVAFGDIVPTGLEVRGNTIYMAQAGPNPHLPENGKVLAFGPKIAGTVEIASGSPLPVDVEFGLGNTLYVLGQGHFSPGADDGSPADPLTGNLAEINADGTVTTVAEGLDQPMSMEFIGNTAYIVTFGGEVWVIDDVSKPPFGK